MIHPSLKRVGLFGGTFDPIHTGHIAAALGIKDKFKLDRIYFVPAFISPFKTDLGPESSHHRLAMIKRAIQEHAHFSVSEFELNKKGVSYTIETIKHYKKILPQDAHLYFIMGSDVFLEISKWKNPQEIFSLSSLIVVSRPGYQIESLEKVIRDPQLIKEFIALKKGKQYKHFPGHIIYFIRIPGIQISSAELRQKIADNHPYSSFVSPGVKDYIVAHALYKSRKADAQKSP